MTRVNLNGAGGDAWMGWILVTFFAAPSLPGRVKTGGPAWILGVEPLLVKREIVHAVPVSTSKL